ncbi:killer toxin Kp4/SMK [Lasiosphaeria ovina]|uniref:Killer toxin Kp4/SMK n=1 Tax=Lasiosphaeria ovina TaxID=92902 RepID=A0AAE0N8B6_9PEZI|nr:killer toxin Kp4/SMK [Lasiosphaeria ovina]
MSNAHHEEAKGQEKATILASVAEVDALGINYRGSSQCSGSARELVVKPSQEIGCVSGNLCAFTQNLFPSVWLTSAEIKMFGQQIIDHGCNSCGSTPVYSNDVTRGELTFNYVSNPCTSFGLCE